MGEKITARRTTSGRFWSIAMSAKSPPAFSQAGPLDTLDRLDADGLDELEFGVIGFGHDADARVQRYNATERRGSAWRSPRWWACPCSAWWRSA